MNSVQDLHFQAWLDRLVELQEQGLAVARECLAWQRRHDREKPEGEAILTRMEASGAALNQHWESRPDWQEGIPSDVRLRTRHFCEQSEAITAEMQSLRNARQRIN